MSRLRRVIVIGAGPAGLSAAWAAAEAGCAVTVLEAQDQVGGLSGSFDFEGFRVDYGPHRLHRAASEEVLALYRLAIGDRLLLRERRGRVHLGRGSLPFPLSVLGALRGLGLRELARLVGSAAWAKLRPPSDPSYAGEASRRLGRRALEVLYGPAARKVWGVAAGELDEALGRARVQRRSPWDAARPGRSARFFYPADGFGALSEGLRARLGDRGAEVRTGLRASGLVCSGGRVSGVRTEQGELQADAVIATAPLSELCEWIGAAPPQELTYRALVLLYCRVDVPRLSAEDVHYFADGALPANRLFEAKAFHAGAGPAGHTVVGYDLPCAVGDRIWTATPEELTEQVRPALERAAGRPLQVARALTRRVPRAYPIYRKGYAGPRDAALDRLARVEGLYPLGRHALFVHDNVHHAIAAGLACGRIVGAGGAAQTWRRAMTPFLHAQIED